MKLTLSEWSAVISAVFMTVGTLWYIGEIVRRKVSPVFPAWIVLGGTLTLSFLTYLTSPNASIIKNIANATGAVSAMSILCVLTYQRLNKRQKIVFNPFQRFCLKSSLMIAIVWVVIVWGFKGSGTLPNVLTQVLMIIGYIVMVPKIWNSTKNEDSFVLWSCICLSCLFGLVIAIVRKDGLSILYATRGAIASGTIITLMYRADRKYRLAIA